MEAIYNVMILLIEQLPWISIMYTIHKTYENKFKHIEISLFNCFTLKADK